MKYVKQKLTVSKKNFYSNLLFLQYLFKVNIENTRTMNEIC